MCYGGCDCAKCSGEPIKPMEHKKQWVQHISGQGEKWELFDEPCDPEVIDWQVKSCQENNCHYLPKSEYHLCEPPEVWRDVTEGCRVDDYSNRSGDFWSILHAPTGANVMSKCNDGYRLRKVQALIDGKSGEVVKQWAFIVEQKVSQ